MNSGLLRTEVSDHENIIRLILSPKNIEEDGTLKPSFITLRKDEEGISFLRLDFMGRESVIEKGNARANMYSKPSKKQKLYGWAKAIAKEITDIAPETISLKIDEPDIAPEHVTICFSISDKTIKGIVTDIRILHIFEKIRRILKIEIL